MEKWLEDVENELKAPYSNNDLVVLNSHLKKQEELEEDISGHRDRLQELVVTAQQFQKEKHFLADELEERVDQLVQRCVSAWPVSCHIFLFLSAFFFPEFFFFPSLHHSEKNVLHSFLINLWFSLGPL